MTAGGPGAPAAPAAATQRTFRIVISYRRVDTGGDARSLAETLERRFGDENVFLDIEAIEPGEPFDQAIDRAVAASDVMLVLIGRHWMTPDEQGQRRIDNPDDVVRMELRSALQRGLLVIPLLVEDAKMPSQHELPPDVAAFSKRNAEELRRTKWRSDVESLVDELVRVRRKKFGSLRGRLADLRDGLRRAPRAAAPIALVVVLLLAALVAVLVLRGVAGDGGGGDGGGGGGDGDGGTGGDGEALHAPLAADETLLFVSGGRIMRLDGDARELLTMRGPEFGLSVEWTADGRLVYQEREDGNLWISDWDGTNRRRVTTDGQGDGHPSVTRGGLVAFDRPEDAGGRHRIWVVRADGPAAPDLLGEGEDARGAAPDWSSDGSMIAYQRSRDESSAQHIWLMDADGNPPVELLPDLAAQALFPAWAPNGRRIAFLLPQDESGCRIGIARVGSEESVLPLEGAENCGEVAWSPDGQYLVVVASDGLWTIAAGGGEEPQRLVKIDRARSPAWVRRPG